MHLLLRGTMAVLRPRLWVFVLWVMVALVTIAPHDLPLVQQIFDESSLTFALLAPFILFAYLSIIGFTLLERSAISLGAGYVFPYLVYLFVLLSTIDIVARASAGILARGLVALLRSRAQTKLGQV